MRNFQKIIFGLIAMVLLSSSGGVFAAIAGHVQFVHGKVQLTTATGVTHAIRKGEAVNEGDTLLSSPTASAQLRMEDGGIIAMRPDSKLKIDRFVFDGKQDGTERSFFSLFKGGFRAITGTIGKKNKVNYRITTPATTIGIRGTDHETFVVTPDSSLAAATPAGTYNKVNLGETSMTTNKGTVYVLPNQMGFAGDADQMPRLQPINLDIFTAATQPGMRGGGEKHEGKSEGGEGGGQVRETEIMNKDGMRDHASVDKFDVHGTETMEKGGGEGAAKLSPSTDDGVKNAISTIPEAQEPHH